MSKGEGDDEEVKEEMVGELLIGGTGVSAYGYLHREDLTREKFLPDPFLLKAKQ